MTETPWRDGINGIALDLGGTKVAAARIRNGRVTDRLVQPTSGDDSPEKHVEQMCRMADDLGLTERDKVGVAVTGRIDGDGCWHAVNSDTLTDVQNANLNTLVSEAFARPVLVVNDALAAAKAEYAFGAGGGSSAMAYVTVSTGVGAGFVIGGRPLQSRNGLMGHVGFSTSRGGTRHCGSGRTGTVESIAGGRAIAAMAAEAVHSVEGAKQVFDQRALGANWASDIVDISAATIAELLGNLAAMLGIDRVVLGGSIGLADGYADRVRHFLSREPELFRPMTVIAALGQDSVLVGALIDP